VLVNKKNLIHLIRKLVNEGKHDQNIYKAIIVLGPAGSGKSTIINKLKEVGPGLKYLNSDAELELELSKKLNVPYQQEKRTTEDQKSAFTNYLNDPKNEDEFNQLRSTATDKNDKRLEKHYLTGNLGFIMEGTGSSSGSVDWFNKTFEALKQKGYQVYLIGVYTPLDICLKRNENRGKSGGRGLPADRIIQTYYGFIGNFIKMSQSKHLDEANIIVNIEDTSKEEINKKIDKILNDKDMHIYHQIANLEKNAINDKITLFKVSDLLKKVAQFLNKNKKENQNKYQGR